MKKQFIVAVGSVLLIPCFNMHAQPIPGNATSAGLTYIVPDMLIWYNTNKLAGNPYNGHVTNGPIRNLNEFEGNTSLGNDHWYQNATVLGDSTFLIAANTFADDGSWDGSTNAMAGGVIGTGEPSFPPGLPNQRNIVIFQPVNGGAPTIGEGFYDDFGNPYRLHTMMRQKMGESSHVAGDKRPGAVNFMTEGMASFWYCKLWHDVDYFNTDGRFDATLPLFATGYPSGNNQDGEGVLYPGWPLPYPAEGVDDVDMSTVQSFTLNPLTLLQTPTSKAWVGPYQSQTNSIPINICNNIQNNAPPSSCNNGGAGDNWMGYEGNIVALDNGNFVSVVGDPSGFFGGANSSIGREDAVATIFAPDGSIVKDTFWVSTNSINMNVAAYRGGFCVRCRDLFSFFDNDGNLQHRYSLLTNSVGFQTDRGDHTRLASHILSHYVYLAGQVGTDYRLGIWDAQTGQYVTNVVVDSDIAPLANLGGGDDGGGNAELAVDEFDRVCVAFEGVPTGSGYAGQDMARVLKWDGTNVTFLTPTFFPFVDSDNTNNVQAVGGFPRGFNTTTPSVAMTRDAICIAGKGDINSTNNATTGAPDTGDNGTTLYVVLSHPAPAAATIPTISVTPSGPNLNVSWDAAAGLFTVQTNAVVDGTGTWGNFTAGNVAPPVSVPIGAGNEYVRLVRNY